MVKNVMKCNEKDEGLHGRYHAASDHDASPPKRARRAKPAVLQGTLKDKIASVFHAATEAVIDGLQDPAVPPEVKLQTAGSLLSKLFSIAGDVHHGPLDVKQQAEQMTPTPSVVPFENNSDDNAIKRMLEELQNAIERD